MLVYLVNILVKLKNHKHYWYFSIPNCNANLKTKVSGFRKISLDTPMLIGCHIKSHQKNVVENQPRLD